MIQGRGSGSSPSADSQKETVLLTSKREPASPRTDPRVILAKASECWGMPNGRAPRHAVKLYRAPTVFLELRASAATLRLPVPARLGSARWARREQTPWMGPILGMARRSRWCGAYRDGSAYRAVLAKVA
jgi:hypothetical protein